MADLVLPPNSSASQLVTYVMCPRRYYFRYVLGLRAEHRSVALIFGSALHSVIGWWFTERLAGKQPSLDEAPRVFEADLASEIAGETVRWGKSSHRSLEEKGRALVRAYLEKHGGLPVKAVEAGFLVDIEDPETGEKLPRRMKGYFDLLLEDESVVEVKTSASRWNESVLVRHLQVGTYVGAKCALDGGPVKVLVHVLVKTKSPQIEEHLVERGEPGNRWWFLAAQEIETAIGAGVFPPNPGMSCFDCEYATKCAGWVYETPASRRSLPVHRDERRAGQAHP